MFYKHASYTRLPYVQSFVDKQTGKVFHYFRKRGCKRVRLPGLLGSREFMEAYQRALDGPLMPVGATRTKSEPKWAALARSRNKRAKHRLQLST